MCVSFVIDALHWCHYTNVKIFDIAKYNDELISKLTTKLRSFNGKYYICRTCNSPFKKLKAPFQAVFDGLS